MTLCFTSLKHLIMVEIVRVRESIQYRPPKAGCSRVVWLLELWAHFFGWIRTNFKTLEQWKNICFFKVQNAIRTQQNQEGGFYDFYYAHKTSLNAFLMGNNVNQTKAKQHRVSLLVFLWVEFCFPSTQTIFSIFHAPLSRACSRKIKCCACGGSVPSQSFTLRSSLKTSREKRPTHTLKLLSSLHRMNVQRKNQKVLILRVNALEVG